MIGTEHDEIFRPYVPAVVIDRLRESPAGTGPRRLGSGRWPPLIAQGRTNAQIAAQLYISIHTVGSHLDRIQDKTGCRRRADLIRLGPDRGPGLASRPPACPPQAPVLWHVVVA